MSQLFTSNREKLENEKKVLTFCIGKKHFSFAIAGLAGYELFSLGHFTNGNIDEKLLSQYFSEHSMLKDTFFQTQVVFDYPESILVPFTHLKNNAELLLKTMNVTIIDSKIMSDSLDDRQLQIIYSVPVPVFNWLKNKFPFLQYMHVYSLLLRSDTNSSRPSINNDSDGCFLIDFKTEEFSVLALKGEKILLAQYYSYTSSGDVVYQLVKICKHFSFSQNKVRLLISGLIESQSALFNEINQFFTHVDLRNASDWADIISSETDHQPHYFALLNDLVRCAS